MKAIMFPGQGSQYKGMGKDLFAMYRDETRKASEVLGYDLEELCVNDPQRQLGKTAYTQPALYVINALGYYAQKHSGKPEYLIGHSLGEYNALLAAGAFDFITGLKLVQRRGALMAAASGGGMAAVLGISVEQLQQELQQRGHHDIDIANYNTPTQTIIAGQQASITKVMKDFDAAGIKIIPLFVSAPFHSRYMESAAQEFSEFLQGFKFSPLQTPVIANTIAQPYDDNNIINMLSIQMARPVHWARSIQFLLNKGVTAFTEIGSVTLTKMVDEIKQHHKPPRPSSSAPEQTNGKTNLAIRLGSQAFRDTYGVKYTYVTGGMYRAIASNELVVRVAKAGLLGFMGTGGLSLKEIELNIQYVQKSLSKGDVYGMNLLHNLYDAELEAKTVELYLKYGIQNVEAAGYMQITRALILFRLKGLRKNEKGGIVCDHRIIAKISRPEVAEAFMRPAPEKMVNELLEQGLITKDQATFSKLVPMSYDICVEADSAGHTDGGVALVLLPSIQQLRKRMSAEHIYSEDIRIGLAGGIGTPQAAACAYVMGADFILTGSINQCTAEAGVSDIVKDLLQEINVQDTDYAPAGDMFEIGAKVQVLKKGVLFPARANKLYSLYNQYDKLEDIPAKVIDQLEKNYFKKEIDAVWRETRQYLIDKGLQAEIIKAEQRPRHKMALVFRWYFGYSARLAFQKEVHDVVNLQVHTGPSLGAFNQWVKGTDLENWRNRHVEKIAIRIMEETALLLHDTLSQMNINK